MSERISVALQYALPKQALTRLAGAGARARGGRLTTAVIRWFVRRYGVDMSEAEQPDPGAYATFNDFFTRPLRAAARPLSDAAFICPVDGALSQCGPIEAGRIFQAKGRWYSALELLGGDHALAAGFADGDFATLYLSPRDYHRIHMPCDGRLRQMIHVPGELFSVNPATARGVPRLFARNERVVCVFDGAGGPFVMVLVGATIVGSMATVWHGVVNSPRTADIVRRNYADGEVTLRKGEEMGRFLLGSTVVLLFPCQVLRFASDWIEGRPVRMGEAMANAGVGPSAATPG